MCGHTRDPVIYSKLHRNPLRGLGAPGGQNLAFPITLASRFYNSLYYRTSRDWDNRCSHHKLILSRPSRHWIYVRSPQSDFSINSHMSRRILKSKSSTWYPRSREWALQTPSEPAETRQTFSLLCIYKQFVACNLLSLSRYVYACILWNIIIDWVLLGHIACTQCMRCGPLLYMSHVAWSVCLCVGHRGELVNRSRWRLAADSRNHILDQSQDLTKPFAVTKGDKLAMRPYAILLWTQ